MDMFEEEDGHWKTSRQFCTGGMWSGDGNASIGASSSSSLEEL